MEIKNTAKTGTTPESKELANIPDENMSERFSNMVMSEFGTRIAPIEATDKMKQLIMGYFIEIDRALKVAEDSRLRKSEAKRDPIPANWKNANLSDLAVDVMHYARIGMDMSLENMLFAIPYKNNKTQKYDITLMEGYNGKQFISERYAIHRPLAVAIELVYSNDTFEPIKKTKDNPIESYQFDIPKPFDRGDIIGGFGYIEFEDPRQNKLIIMTKAQIDKRKPDYASVEFWGGEKDKWENGQKVGKERVDGWYDEMCLKTIKREVYSAKYLPRDPAKIDEHYRYTRRREAESLEAATKAAMELYPDATVLTIDSGDDGAPLEYNKGTGEIKSASTSATTSVAGQTAGQQQMEF